MINVVTKNSLPSVFTVGYSSTLKIKGESFSLYPTTKLHGVHRKTVILKPCNDIYIYIYYYVVSQRCFKCGSFMASEVTGKSRLVLQSTRMEGVMATSKCHLGQIANTS